MSMLTVHNLSKTYHARDVLSSVDLTVEQGMKLAIVGENGAGKSTLFRILTGEEEADQGSYHFARGCVWASLSQQVEKAWEGSLDVLAAAGSERQEQALEEAARVLQEAHDSGDRDWEVNASRHYEQVLAELQADPASARADFLSMLAGLGLKGEILSRPYAQLSGGEKMRVALAQVLHARPDLLFLDEPTNHLDVQAICWLEGFIQRYRGTLVFISHDRAFIDHCATDTAELQAGRLQVYKGNYQAFVRQKQEEQERQLRRLQNLEEERLREAEVAQTMLSHRKMSSYHAREKRVYKLDEAIQEARRSLAPGQMRMHFHFLPEAPKGDPNRLYIRGEDLGLAYEAGRPLFHHVNFELKAGQKLLIVGPNGCGKSSLMRLLLAELEPSQGRLQLARGIDTAYMSQYCQFSDEGRSVLEELLARSELGEGAARSQLARYGFRDIDVFKQIQNLSGGERSRLYLCCLLQERPELLFLDEPTNHLDIYAKEILEQALVDFPGAIVAVSHDRYLIERLGHKFLGFAAGTAEVYTSYPAYLEAWTQREAELQAQASQESQAAAQERRAVREARQAAQVSVSEEKSAAPQNPAQRRRQKARLQREMQALEQELEALEVEKAETEAQMNVGQSVDYRRYAQLLERIEEQTEAYLEKGLELEDLEA